MLDITYSNAEKWIGAVLWDSTLAFWDVKENFSFEKCIHT